MKLYRVGDQSIFPSRRNDSNAKGDVVEVQEMYIIHRSEENQWYHVGIKIAPDAVMTEDMFRAIINRFQKSLEDGTALTFNADGGEFARPGEEIESLFGK